jgi:hypothetical protein
MGANQKRTHLQKTPKITKISRHARPLRHPPRRRNVSELMRDWQTLGKRTDTSKVPVLFLNSSPL